MRNSARALVVLAGVVAGVPLAAASAGPALADSVPTTAYDAGPGLSVTETLGFFVGIPLLVIGVVYALVFALTGRRGQRYPAGGTWTAPEQWFGDKPAGSVEATSAVEAASGGADEPGAPAELGASSPAEGEGGARGRW